MQPAESWRLFIAIPLPENVRREIGSMQAEWRKAAPGLSARWTPSDQMHLTLKFLGDLQTTHLAALTARLRVEARVATSLQLTARAAGAFPNARAPRVLWAGVTDAEGRLSALHQAVDRATAEFVPPGASGETFVGHITFGRIREGGRPISRVVADLISAAAGREFGRWTAEAFELMRSELLSGRARHTRLSEFRLGPDARAT